MRLLSRPQQFWKDIWRVQESATTFVVLRTLAFGVIALVVTLMEMHPTFPPVAIPMTPYEVLGVALGALLVLRTNVGYERWWEARKLWGGIVNQCRNLAVQALSYGPDDPEWRRQIVAWTAAFAHVSRSSLRSERDLSAVERLLGTVAANRVAAADHMPLTVSLAIGRLLQQALDLGMDRMAFTRAEEERARLTDHLGGCERILKTPIPVAYSVEIRRFIFLFLVTLPFGIISKVEWLTPIVVMLVALPILALDEIGVELQNPFAQSRLNHLPLNQICDGIERELTFLLDSSERVRRPVSDDQELSFSSGGPVRPVEDFHA